MTGLPEYAFGLAEIALLSAVLQTLFLVMVLNSTPGKASAANRLLCASLLALALILTELACIEAGVTLKYPHLLGVSLPGYLVLAPGYLLYTKALAGRELSRRDAFHLLPALAGILLALPFFRLPAEEKAALLSQMTGAGFESFPLLAVFAISLISFQMMAYFYRAYADLDAYGAEAKAEFATVHILAADWLKKLSIGFCLFVAVFYLAAAEVFFFNPYRRTLLLADVLGFSIAGFVFFLSWKMYRHPELFALYTPGMMPQAQPGDAGDRRAKYEKTSLAPHQIRDHEKRLLELMERHKPFLDGELRLSDLAGSLGLPAHHLSQVINVSQERSFFDFINRYRIDHAKGLLSDPARAGNILQIAQASGFNSKAYFNRVFKKETGMTPSAFKKRLLSEQDKEHLAR